MMVNKKLIIVGILAGLVMGMVVMVYEAFFGQGFWSPLVYISATIFRDLQISSPSSSFLLIPVVIGLMGHKMNSIVLAVVFSSFLAVRFKSRESLIIAAMAYGLIVFVMMWYVVIPLIDPVMLNLNPYVFAFSHIMWGLVLGIGISIIRKKKR